MDKIDAVYSGINACSYEMSNISNEKLTNNVLRSVFTFRDDSVCHPLLAFVLMNDR